MKYITSLIDKKRFIVLDQIRTIDKACLVKFLDVIDKTTGFEVLKILKEMFDI